MQLNLKLNTAELIRNTVNRNTLAKISTIKDTSILREFKSAKFKNKNFCPVLFKERANINAVSTKILKNALILIECL